MEFSCNNKTLQKIKKELKSGEISLVHKFQRKEGQWNLLTKSELIDSLLRGYPINPTYGVLEDNEVLAIIDGVQRLSTVRDYLEDKFALSKKLKSVTIKIKDADGMSEVEVEIAGKKFSELDEKVREELMSAELQIYKITKYTEEDIREMFRRQNAGKPLNPVQKMMSELSDDLRNAMDTITGHPVVIGKFMTEAQLKSSAEQSIALEVLMMTEMNDEYDFGSFNKRDKEKFIECYNEIVDFDKVNLIKDALDKLDDAFDEVKIPKTTVPFVIYAAYKVMEEGKDFDKFVKVAKGFLENYDNNEEYKSMLTNGTSSSESVKFRIDYWKNVVDRM